MVVGVWCYAFLFAIGPLAQWGSFGPEPYGTACCINWYEPNNFSDKLGTNLGANLTCETVSVLMLFPFPLESPKVQSIR